MNQVQITQTFNVARFIALESAKRNVKAHVRLQQPFYTSEKKPAEEKDAIKPEGVNGTWWHESLRAIAAIQKWVYRPNKITTVAELTLNQT